MIILQVFKQSLASAKQKKERIEKEHTDFKNTKTMEEDVCMQDVNKFKQEVDRLRNLLDKLQKYGIFSNFWPSYFEVCTEYSCIMCLE